MASVLPAADLFALTLEPNVRFDFGGRKPRTTFVDQPAIRRRRDLLLPFMPLAWRYASRDPYDVVVTSSHACVKGFRPGRRALHLCYCYTPMRYLWLKGVDRRRPSSPGTWLAEEALRRWDRSSVRWVDEFAVISSAVHRRVQEIYGRESVVVHPPVDTDHFTPASEVDREDLVLAVSRTVGYKRLDLAVRACAMLDQPLVIAGSAEDGPRLRALAEEVGASVSFVISPTDDALRDLYRRARLLVFPADEDFGIVSVEAQACGTPVVALAGGGSLDTVVPGVTGVLVPSQTVESFTAGIEAALNAPPDAADCRRHAERFSVDRFRREFGAWVRRAAEERGIDLSRELCLPVGP